MSMGPIKAFRQKRLNKHATKPTAIDRIIGHSNINPQLSSPLLTVLPAEIRIQIFQYALIGYLDPARPYSVHTFWYRPGYTHARTITTSLLQTCRRIYLETDRLPIELNEHVVWGVERSRIPPNHSPYLLNNRLKTSQRSAIQYVHIFAQQFWLEDWKDQWLDFSRSWPDGFPKRLKITIRHSDWWYNLLGENSPLALDPKRKGRARIGEWVGAKEPFEDGSWGQRFASLIGLEELELELETVEYKRAELDLNLERATSWKFPLANGNILIMDPSATIKTTWIGSKHFKGIPHASTPTDSQPRKSSSAKFMTFKSLPKDRLKSELLAPDDKLEYYVVTMTWRAQPVSEEEDLVEEGERDHVTGKTESNGNNTASAPPRMLYNRINAVPTFYGPLYGSA